MNNPIRILVVEDEAMSALFLKTLLKKAGHEVTRITATGEEAIKLATSELIDIILMDIRLAGGIDGFQAAEQIKTFKKDIPLIFMSGYSNKSHKEKASEFNPIGYLIKPFKSEELLSLISSHFNHS